MLVKGVGEPYKKSDKLVFFYAQLMYSLYTAIKHDDVFL